MIAPMSDDYRAALTLYSRDLIEATAKRVRSKATPAQRKLPADELLVVALSNPKVVAKLIDDLDPSERQGLAVFRRGPGIRWRWDHAVRLLSACGISSAYRVLQTLLSEGLLLMRPPRADEPLARFELAEGIVHSGLPTVALAPPLETLPIELDEPVGAIKGTKLTEWRATDGWELPLRLAALWRLAWRSPIKRTQNKQLFKRDFERLKTDPLLSAGMLDASRPIPEPGLLAYGLALADGWLSEGEEQRPLATLEELWPNDLHQLQLRMARSMLMVEDWNELGSAAPAGLFASEVASARQLILMWLATLPEDHGVSVEDLADRLSQSHPPWNAAGELVGAFRHADKRRDLALEFVRVFVEGALYQIGVVALAMREQRTYARLTPVGRALMGLAAHPPSVPAYPQTLLAQPNHQVIVYRQGLSVPLLSKLVTVAEPRSIGAALTFELTAESVYHGMETGLSGDRIIELLEGHGGRALPGSLAESIRTWGQKRQRLSVFSNASLFEFASNNDLNEALERGLEGIPLTDRLLLITSDQETSYQNVKITSSRDYRFPSEICVAPESDGVTLVVDLARSDLMLESELLRFSDPVPSDTLEGSRRFRISTESAHRAIRQGFRLNDLEEWFGRRCAVPVPPSAQILFRASFGLDARLEDVLVLFVESSLVADGLQQHPATKALLTRRLGPTSLVVGKADLETLRSALDELGISLPPVAET